MSFKWIAITLIFLAGLYTVLTYSSSEFKEGFTGQPRCHDMLIQDGEELILKNSKLAEIPGVNPVRFKNLEEYAEFVQWQRSQGIHCPVLYYTKTYDAQSHEGYLPASLPPIPMDSNPLNINPFTDKPPFGSLTYPRLDPHNQDIGNPSEINEYYMIGEGDPISANALDTNWGGSSFSTGAIDNGHYKGNEVSMARRNSSDMEVYPTSGVYTNNVPLQNTNNTDMLTFSSPEDSKSSYNEIVPQYAAGLGNEPKAKIGGNMLQKLPTNVGEQTAPQSKQPAAGGAQQSKQPAAGGAPQSKQPAAGGAKHQGSDGAKKSSKIQGVKAQESA